MTELAERRDALQDLAWPGGPGCWGELGGRGPSPEQMLEGRRRGSREGADRGRASSAWEPVLGL